MRVLVLFVCVCVSGWGCFNFGVTALKIEFASGNPLNVIGTQLQPMREAVSMDVLI